MIKAIAVDFGGVLFSDGGKIVYEKLRAKYNYDEAVIRTIIKSDTRLQASTGKITDDSFWKWAGEQLPAGYDVKSFRDDYYGSYTLDQSMFDFITGLKQQECEIIAFSGNMKTRVEYLDQKYHVRQLFDKEVFSFDVGYTKPEKEFVRTMIEKAGCLPEEIVYIDDHEKSLEPARVLGVHCFLYTGKNIEEIKRSMRVLGISVR